MGKESKLSRGEEWTNPFRELLPSAGCEPSLANHQLLQAGSRGHMASVASIVLAMYSIWQLPRGYLSACHGPSVGRKGEAKGERGYGQALRQTPGHLKLKKKKRLNKLAETAKIPSQSGEQSSLKDRQAGMLN